MLCATRSGMNKRTQISVPMLPEQREALAALAAAQHRTMAAQLRHLLDQAVMSSVRPAAASRRKGAASTDQHVSA